jgi:hypothetical protein
MEWGAPAKVTGKYKAAAKDTDRFKEDQTPDNFLAEIFNGSPDVNLWSSFPPTACRVSRFATGNCQHQTAPNSTTCRKPVAGTGRPRNSFAFSHLTSHTPET